MTGVIAAVVVAAAGTAYGIHANEQAKNRAEDAARDQANRQKKLEEEAKTRAANEEGAATAIAARDSAVSAQRRRAGQNRSGTLMTSPLSSLGGNLTDTSSGKTLIGQ